MHWTRIALAMTAAATLLLSATATASAATTPPANGEAITQRLAPREEGATAAPMAAADVCGLATPTQAALSALCNLLQGNLLPSAVRPAIERVITRHAEQLAPGFLKEHLQTWCGQQIQDHPDSKIARRCEQQIKRLAHLADQQSELAAKCAAALADPKAKPELVERCKQATALQQYREQCGPLQNAANPDPALLAQCKQLREQLKAHSGSDHDKDDRDKERRPDAKHTQQSQQRPGAQGQQPRD